MRTLGSTASMHSIEKMGRRGAVIGPQWGTGRRAQTLSLRETKRQTNGPMPVNIMYFLLATQPMII